MRSRARSKDQNRAAVTTGYLFLNVAARLTIFVIACLRGVEPRRRKALPFVNTLGALLDVTK